MKKKKLLEAIMKLLNELDESKLRSVYQFLLHLVK